MKYKSELIKEIVETRGHEKSSIHYESECVESWIEETKGAYPKLCDYQSEWLNYINENPLGEFPYETVTNVTDAAVNNVVPYAYKSAILKGSTKYRDIDTGEILDTFDETKNLELVSVKMPVLTTTGKNLFDEEWESGSFNNDTGVEITDSNTMRSKNYIKVNPNETYTIDTNAVKIFYDKNHNVISVNTSTSIATSTFNTPENCYYMRIRMTYSDYSSNKFTKQIEQGTQATSYEPFKSNILTVNEDVTLRSNGSVYDELDLLTGKLTQRIDEDGSVLTQEVVKTVDLNIQDQDGNTLRKIKPIEGTLHIHSDGTPLKPTITMEIPVEATSQNLASFIKED